jgi:hypothetical protein
MEALLKRGWGTIQGQNMTLSPNRTMRGARISVGTRYTEPTAGFRVTNVEAFVTLKKSNSYRALLSCGGCATNLGGTGCAKANGKN